MRHTPQSYETVRLDHGYLSGRGYESPSDTYRRQLLNILPLFVEFETDHVRACMRQGTLISKTVCWLGAKPSKPSKSRGRQHTTSDMATLLKLAYGTVRKLALRKLQRHEGAQTREQTLYCINGTTA